MSSAALALRTDSLAQTFLCPYLHSTISRHSCGARHRYYASKGSAAVTNERLGVASCVCRTCPIGSEHARGQRPTVQLVQVIAKPGSRKSRIPRCFGCGEPITRQRMSYSRSLFCSLSCESAVEQLRSKDDAAHLPDRF